MGRLKKTASVIFLLADAFVLGSFALSQFGPLTLRLRYLLGQPAYRIAIAICLAICALQALYLLGRVLFERRDPDCIVLASSPEIEVAVAAVASAARAAVREDHVLVEDIHVKAPSRADAPVRIKVEAIALGEEPLSTCGERIESRVADACAALLGTRDVTCKVRFLPSKTVTYTKEVSGE